MSTSTGDTLRSTLQQSIEEEYADQLSSAIEAAKQAHQLRVEKALDAAVLAIRGKTKTAAQKKERKPRADKGARRLKRGLPEAPVASGPACGDVDCEHFESMHRPACTALNCSCKKFVSPADDAAF